MLADGGAQAVGVVDGVDHLVAGILEEPAEALAEQHLVFGDHDSHGSSAVTTVPRPAGLSTVRLPPSAATRSVMPASPEPGGRDGAADAVVTDAHDERAVPPAGADADLRGVGVLGRVGERLARHEVGRGLQTVVEALVGGLDADAQRRP